MSRFNSNNGRNSDILIVVQHVSAVDYGKCSCYLLGSKQNGSVIQYTKQEIGLFFFCVFLYVSLFIVNILCGIIYDDIYENKFRMRLENSTNLFHIKIHTSLSYYNNYYLFIF